MNEKNDFALVPRPPSALEKAKPGAKHILASMVADTLTLVKAKPPAKRVLSVLIGGFEGDRWPDLLRAIAESQWGDQFEVSVGCEKNAVNLLAQAEQQPVDLFILSVNKEENLAAHKTLLAKLRAQYGKPILGWGIKLPGFDGHVEWPSLVENFLNEFARLLNLSHESGEIGHKSQQFPKQRPPRITMLDDETNMLDLLKGCAEGLFKNATILTFTDAKLALQELLRQEPDLFTTDWNRPAPLRHDEILQILAAKKVEYPILVITGGADMAIQRKLNEFGSRGLNVTLLSKPFTIDEFWWQLLTQIGVSKL